MQVLHERIRLEQMTVLMMTNQFKKPKMYLFLYVLISLINSTPPFTQYWRDVFTEKRIPNFHELFDQREQVFQEVSLVNN